MSTKIYNGYRIETGHIQQILEILDAVGIAYDFAAEQHMLKLTARTLASIWDGMTIQKEKGVDSPFWAACNAIKERHERIKASNRRDPEFDFDFSIVIFPKNDRTLAQVFTENEEFSRAFVSHPMVKPCSYWDNTDRPEDVSEAEWEHRKQAWDEAVGNDTPARRGLTREFNGMFLPHLHPEAVLLKLSSPESMQERAEMEATRILLDEYQKAKPTDVEHVGSWYFAARSWIKEGDRLKIKTAEILPKITNPTLKDILS